MIPPDNKFEKFEKRVKELTNDSKIEFLHDKILKHREYVNLDEETKYIFEFACVCKFWPIEENMYYSLELFYKLMRLKNDAYNDSIRTFLHNKRIESIKSSR